MVCVCLSLTYLVCKVSQGCFVPVWRHFHWAGGRALRRPTSTKTQTQEIKSKRSLAVKMIILQLSENSVSLSILSVQNQKIYCTHTVMFQYSIVQVQCQACFGTKTTHSWMDPLHFSLASTSCPDRKWGLLLTSRLVLYVTFSWYISTIETTVSERKHRVCALSIAAGRKNRFFCIFTFSHLADALIQSDLQ